MRIAKSGYKLDVAKQYMVKCFNKEENIFEQREQLVITENLLDIYVNEVLMFKMTCTPSKMEELTLGYLYSEGFIKSYDEVEYIYICKQGVRAKVYLKAGTVINNAQERPELVSSDCVKNGIASDSCETHEKLKALPPHTWSKECVFAQYSAFQKNADLHKKTRGAHSCYLSINGSLQFVCEDISRHNAVDKAIGCALINKMDLSRASLFTSGRVASDMTTKMIRSGIPVLASHSVPTDKAVEMAKKYNLTLIGAVRTNGFNIYSE
jgi:FdhD protein